MKKLNHKLLIFIIFAGFMVFGFSENIKGPAIPVMQSDFKLSETKVGMLLALNSLGYLIACSFTGFLIKKRGIKFSTVLAFAVMLASGFLIYISFNYQTFSASYFLMYIGNGILEIALGVLAAKIFTKNTGKMMNLSHFFYGLSSIVAPIFATSLMKISIGGISLSWQGMYFIMLSLSLVPLLPSFFTKFPKEEEITHERLSIMDFAKDPSAWIIVFILSLGVISELTVGGWLVNYLEKVYQYSNTKASGILSAFFLTFTLSRLILGHFTDKIGFVKTLIIFSFISGVLSIAGVILGEHAVFLFALSGAGIALIYPTVMALLANKYKQNSDIAISFTVTLMGIGSILGNFMVGFIIDISKNIFVAMYGFNQGSILGMKMGYSFVGVCALLCSALSIILMKLLKKDPQSFSL